MYLDEKPIKLVIFDLDNTLTTAASGRKFPSSPGDRMWLPGRLERLHALKRHGYFTAVATNQGGSAFGYFLPRDFDWAMQRLADEAQLSAWEACYSHPNGTVASLTFESPNRKPGPGMLLSIISAMHVLPEQTLYVGDREEDRDAARAAQCHFEWADDYFAVDPGW